MRAGASVAVMVWDLKERRIKRKARRGGWIAWGKCEVKDDIRCQTVCVIAVLVPRQTQSSRRLWRLLTWTCRRERVLKVSA